MNNFAPVVLFAYARADHLKRTLHALSVNHGAKNTDVIVYADGYKNSTDLLDVFAVREFLFEYEKAHDFKSFKIIESEKNKGLAVSIQQGVTEVVNKYGRVIVVEDDIVTSPYFLQFMNEALEKYENEQRVMHISGYNLPLDLASDKPDNFFLPYPQLWGWGTWSESWSKFTSDTDDLIQRVVDKGIKKFNLDGAVDFYEHLTANKSGRLNTWGIKWQASMYINQGLSLNPRQSYTQNIGQDGSGTHSGNVTRYYHHQLAGKVLLPGDLKVSVNQQILELVKDFYDIGKTRRMNAIKNEEQVVSRPFFVKLSSRVNHYANQLKRKLQKGVARVKSLKPNNAVDFNQQQFTQQTAALYYVNTLQPLISKNEPDYFLPNDRLTQISHINTHANRGGAATVASQLQNYLSKDYSSYILAKQVDQPSEYIVRLKQPHKPLDRMLEAFSDSNGWLDFFKRGTEKVAQMQAIKDSDIVHLHNLHGGYFSKFYLPWLSSWKPTIWTLHDQQAITDHAALSSADKPNKYGIYPSRDAAAYPPVVREQEWLVSKNNSEIYNNSKMTIVAVSEWLKERVAKSVLGQHKVQVIHNGVDVEMFSPVDSSKARAELNLSQSAFIVCFVAAGGLQNSLKGGDVVQRLSKMPEFRDAQFLIIGTSESERRQVGNMHFFPYLPQAKLRDIYSAADVMLMPAQAETFGLSIAESMACATPVVAFQTDAIPEVVGECGKLAPQNDIKRLADLLAEFRRMPASKIEALGISARNRVVEKFSLAKMFEKYEKLYLDVFDKAKSGTTT